MHTQAVATPFGPLASSSTFPNGSPATTTFSYGAFDTLLTVTDAAGNTVTQTFDVLGRRTSILDKDTGTQTSTYDAFDEVATSLDANGVTTLLTYDALGRLVSRVAPDGTDTFTFDTAPHGIGKLRSMARAANRTDYAYDALSRPASETWTLDGAPYAYAYTYDAQSRLSSIAYPAAPSGPRFVTDRVYDSAGYLSAVRDVSVPATPKAIWLANAADAVGHATQETLGNGLITTHAYEPGTGRLSRVTTPGVHDMAYAYFPNGNLQQRTDYRNIVGSGVATRTETFTYDGANRLTSATVAGRTPATYSYTYDVLGNLLSADD